MREPTLHRQQLQHGDTLLVVIGKAGNVSGYWRGQLDTAIGQEWQQRHGDQRLGRREDHESRFGLSRAERCFGDDLAVHPDRELRGLQVAIVDLGLDSVAKGVDCGSVQHGS